MFSPNRDQYDYAIESDLKESNLEILQKEFQEKLMTESVESLDSFLPKMHCKNPEQLEKEHRIVVYLRQLKLQFKTDPRQKENAFYDQQKSNIPILKQTIGEGNESPEIRSCQELQFQDTFGTDIPTKKEFNAWLNPFLARKQLSKDF